MFSDRRFPTLLLALLLAPAVLLAGCGKKGDPEPPLRTSPATTTKLTVSQRGNDLLLALPYPTTTSAGQALDGVREVVVYRLTQPVSPSQLELLEPEAGSPATAPSVAGEPPGDAERTEADEPVEPADTDFYAETGIRAADEVDEMEAQREVGREMTEVGEEADAAQAAAEGEDPGDAAADEDEYTPPSRESLLRQMLEPLGPRPFEAGAEQVTSITGDDLERAVSGGELVLRLPLDPAVFDQPSLHYLAVRTIGPSGEPSDLSNQAVIVPRRPPPSPRGLDAEPRADGVHVEWQPQGEVVGYNLYRRNVRARLFDVPVAVPPGDRVSYLDRTAQFGETYVYAVTAVAQRSPLVESAVTQVREVDYADTFAPPAPTNLVALAEDGRVRVVWRGSEADDLAGYHVSRYSGTATAAAEAADGDWQALTAEPQPGTEYIDRQVTAGQTYTYRVTAEDEAGNASDGATASTEAR